MGRRKPKIRWTSVEESFFAEEESNLNMGVDENLPRAEINYSDNSTNGRSHYDSSPNSYRQYNNYNYNHNYNQHHHYRKNYYGQQRRYGQGWGNGPVAPRFERKAAEGRNGSYVNDCDSEEQLPNGFTKIRSKNLDVLFKKDYYAQRSHLSSQNSSTAVSSEHGDEEINEEDRDNSLNVIKEQSPLEESEIDSTENVVENESNILEEKDLTKTEETKVEEENQVVPVTKKSGINGHASPFYPSGYLSPTPPVFVPQQQSGHPNLFLYSPSSNTMIPCEEIVIPNPVVGPDGGTLYQGPSNIYLAFPMENNGMPIPQACPPYMGSQMSSGTLVHYDQYGVPYTQYQQAPTATMPPSSLESAVSPQAHVETDDLNSVAYTSETSIEPSSAESSTPHSPPDLSIYSAANWTNNSGYIPNNYNNPNQWYPQPMSQDHYYSHPHLPKRHYFNNRQNNYYYQSYRPSSQGDVDPAWVPSSTGDSLAEEEEDPRRIVPEKAKIEEVSNEKVILENGNKEEQHQRVFIPGLPEKFASVAIASGKRVQKKRRKKKASSPVTTSTQNESQIQKSEPSSIIAPNNQLSSSEEDLCQSFKKEDEAIESAALEIEPAPAEKIQNESITPSKEIQIPTIVLEKAPTEEREIAEEACTPVPEVVEQIEQPVEEKTLLTAPPASKPKKRRGKRSGQNQSEKQRNATLARKASQEEAQQESGVNSTSDEQPAPEVLVSCQEEGPKETPPAQTPPKEHVEDQWESVPPELKVSKDSEMWETSTRARKSKKGVRQQAHHYEDVQDEVVQIENDSPPVIQAVEKEDVTPIEVPEETPVAPTQLVEECAEQASDVTQEEVFRTSEPRDNERSSSVPERSSSSAPSSRRSTLRKQHLRKKRPSLDDSKSEKGASSIRPVLVHDGLIDFNEGRTLSRRPNDFYSDQAFMIKDIGHGMRDGPITMGRFGLGKYIPPDRSSEILTIAVKEPMEQLEADEGSIVKETVLSGQELELD